MFNFFGGGGCWGETAEAGEAGETGGGGGALAATATDGGACGASGDGGCGCELSAVVAACDGGASLVDAASSASPDLRDFLPGAGLEF
jgi:hypothetical protein